MADRTSTGTAWPVAVAGAVVTVASVVLIGLLLLPGFGGGGPAGDAGRFLLLAIAVPLATFVAVGVLLLLRRPGSPVGWGLAGYGLSFALTIVAEEHAGTAGSRFAELAAWYQTWGWALGLLLLGLVLLHFPDGRLPSHRWRWVRRLIVASGALLCLALADLWRVRHELVPVDDPDLYPAFARAVELIEPLPLVLVIASCVSLARRYRLGGPVERLQLRWLFTAVVVLVFGMIGFLATGGPSRAPLALQLLVLAGMAGIPVAVGVAVLRYRLYEIDRIVSRTVSYAILTALLVGVYAVGVVGVGSLLPAGANDLVVAGTTLLVAALFVPVRRRVGTVVDRRFHRMRYDAERAVTSFAGRLRDEIDPATIETELLQVVAATIPTTTSFVWRRRTALG